MTNHWSRGAGIAPIREFGKGVGEKRENQAPSFWAASKAHLKLMSNAATKAPRRIIATKTTTVDSISSRYLAKALFFRIPGPGGLLEFKDDFADVFADATHVKRFVFCGCFREFSLVAREGLEPTTNGFGDRYSTN